MTFPVTVPVNSCSADENTAAVVPAGIEKLAVLDPEENCVAGSSLGTSACEVNANVSWPVNVIGYAFASVSATFES